MVRRPPSSTLFPYTAVVRARRVVVVARRVRERPGITVVGASGGVRGGPLLEAPAGRGPGPTYAMAAPRTAAAALDHPIALVTPGRTSLGPFFLGAYRRTRGA